MPKLIISMVKDNAQRAISFVHSVRGVKKKTYCTEQLLQLNSRGNEERRHFKHMTKNL